MSNRMKKYLATTARILLLTVFLLIVVLPIYWMLITSFKTNPEIINAQELTYFPKTFTLENYVALFSMFIAI